MRVVIDPDFNPHEREARDSRPAMANRLKAILIHTSVKLVTCWSSRIRIKR